MTRTTYVTKRTTVVSTQRPAIAKKSFPADTISQEAVFDEEHPPRLSVDNELLIWNGDRYVNAPKGYAAARKAPPAAPAAPPAPKGWGDRHDWDMRVATTPDSDCLDVVLRCSPDFFKALLELRHSR